MRKNNKADLAKLIEKDVQSTPSLSYIHGDTMTIIDFMMIVNMICTDKLPCSTFGELADKLLETVLSPKTKFIVVVGDNYSNPHSIKGGEHARRTLDGDAMQVIHNPTMHTPLPKQRRKMLLNIHNKKTIVNFLMEHWLSNKHNLPVNCILYLSGGFSDPRRVVVCTSNVVREVLELRSDHEEADSRIFVHVANAVHYLHPARIVIWSMDTDVLAMCPCYKILLNIEKMYVKTGKGRKIRYIPIHDVVNNLPRDLCLALPHIHSLSGCDSTSALSGHGKNAFFKCFENDQGLIHDIQGLGQDPITITPAAIDACLKVMYKLYDKTNRLSSQGYEYFRYNIFAKKGLSSDKLPPTYDAYINHIKRVNYQLYIWTHADQAMLNIPQPIGIGWQLEDGKLVPIHTTKESAPDTILEFIYCGESCKCKTQCCSCRKQGLICTDVCRCNSETCTNRECDSDSD